MYKLLLYLELSKVLRKWEIAGLNLSSSAAATSLLGAL